MKRNNWEKKKDFYHENNVHSFKIFILTNYTVLQFLIIIINTIRCFITHTMINHVHMFYMLKKLILIIVVDLFLMFSIIFIRKHSSTLRAITNIFFFNVSMTHNNSSSLSFFFFLHVPEKIELVYCSLNNVQWFFFNLRISFSQVKHI